MVLALEKNPQLLKTLSERFRSDQKVVWISLTKDLSCINYVSNALKDNEGFVLDCIQKFGLEVLLKTLPQLQTNPIVVKYKSKIDEISSLEQEVLSHKKNLKDLEKVEEKYLTIENLLKKYISLCDIVKKLIPDIKLYMNLENSYRIKLGLANSKKFPIFSSVSTKQILQQQRYNDWKTAEMEKNLMAEKIILLIPTQKDLI